jgi:hypothetical protein
VIGLEGPQWHWPTELFWSCRQSHDWTVFLELFRPLMAIEKWELWFGGAQWCPSFWTNPWGSYFSRGPG